jgi:hypothetical protein
MSDYLLQNVSIDTVGVSVGGTGNSKIIQIAATSFGGGSVILEGSLDNTLWTTLTYGGNPAIFTSGKILKLDFWPTGMYVRASLTGSTGANNVNAIFK